MLLAHRAGGFAGPVMIAGSLLTGFTALSAGTAARIYLSEQFPTALRGRGHMFGEVLRPHVLRRAGAIPDDAVYGSPTIFFGTLLAVAAIGAFIPVVLGRETVGQLEVVTEGVPELA